MNPLAIFKPKHERQQELKARVLKNKEAVLDAFSSNIEGAKCCEGLLGQKCLGKFCEKFMQLYSVDKDGTKKEFWRCAYIQTPMLLIEIAGEIRRTNFLLEQLLTKEKK